MGIIVLERISSRKFRIYLDDEPIAVLSDKNIAKWQLRTGDELDEEKTDRLLKDIGRRASRTAMDLLLKRDYSEAQLTQKLQQKGYSEEIAMEGIRYVKSWNYLDDARYVRQMIDSRRGKSSRRMTVCRLKEKGVSDAIINDAMEEADWEDDSGIRYEIEKRYTATELCELSEKDLQKLYQSLIRKGYDYADIRHVVNCTIQDECDA